MRQVSTAGEMILSDLLSWELLRKTDVDPKALVRRLSGDDLSVVLANLHDDPSVKNFVCVKMMGAEDKYRRGVLHGDWEIEMFGKNAYIKLTPLHGKTPFPFDLITIGVVA